MTLTQLQKQLNDLKQSIRASGDQPLWIEGKNNVIRLDIGGKRGTEITFPTTYEAARWLEKQIDKYPRVAGSVVVDHIADLYPDSASLKELIQAIMPDPIETKYEVFSADHLSGMCFGKLKADRAADLNLWLLASVMRYFRFPEFKQRHLAGEYTDDDNRLFNALFAIFSWNRRDDMLDLMGDFVSLVCQVTGLPIAESKLQDGSKQPEI